MKRIYMLFALIVFIAVAPVTAQSLLQDNSSHALGGKHAVADSIVPAKKWFVTKYMAVSSSFGFFNGGNAMVFAVPVGLQLNRRITNNWYAFANVTAAPAYVNFNQSFLTTNTSKGLQGNYGFNSSRFNMYTTASVGLMYVNDQKTFSISGSISVERSNNPLLFSPVGVGMGMHPMYLPR